MTNRERTIRGLEACGFKNTGKTSKYLVFKNDDDTRTYFVGRAGGLRMSRTGNVTDSLSLTDKKPHQAFRAVGDPAYRFDTVEQARDVFRRVATAK